MEIAYIQSFIALVESLNFHKAAEREHTSQSTLSRRIQALEKELGVPLLERDSRNVQLTEAGKEFYFQTVKLAEQYRLTIEATKKASSGYSRRLRVGIGYYEHFFLMPFIGTFAQQYPNVKLRVYQFIYEKLMEHFLHGNLDIILTSDQFMSTAMEKMIEKELIWDKEWLLAVCRKSALAKYPIVNRHQLSNTTIISMYNGSAQMIRKIYHNQDFVEPFRSVIQVNSYEAKLTLVNANLGIGFVPSFIKMDSYPEVLLKKLTPPYQPRKFYILYHPSAADAAVQTFIELCKESCKTLAENS